MELWELEEKIMKEMNVIQAQNQGIVAMILELPDIDKRKVAAAYDKRYAMIMSDLSKEK